MGLPSYVVNFDELSDLIKDYLSGGINVDIAGMTFSTTELERLLKDINTKIQGINYDDLIAALNALGANLSALSGNMGIGGTQKIYGYMLEIIPSANQLQYIIDFTAPATGRITGITYSLSAWNHEDNWDLVVDGNKIFKNVYTKEYGEHKFFNVFCPIAGGKKVQFIFNNISESSKILWVDFNILED